MLDTVALLCFNGIMDRERKAKRTARYCQIADLSQADFNRAAPLIPADVLPGSGAEDGWVWGIREVRLHPDWDSPRDPGMGGGVYSEACKGFRAAILNVAVRP